MSNETRTIGGVEIKRATTDIPTDWGTTQHVFYQVRDARYPEARFLQAHPAIVGETLWEAAAPHREDGEGDAEGTLRTMVGKLWEWHRANYKLAFPLTPKEWGDLERILDSAVPVLCAQPPASDTDRAASREDELAEEIAIWRKVAAFYRCCALSGEQPEDGGIIDRFRRMETDREEGTE